MLKTELDLGYTRKVDSMGRIGIPIVIRRQYNIQPDEEYAVKIIEIDGKKYLAYELN
jgi:bifunctional DNA-binding transcriptional regulator/antitoxin component of YhaV-PrlF toxin-antitoxin module